MTVSRLNRAECVLFWNQLKYILQIAGGWHREGEREKSQFIRASAAALIYQYTPGY